MNFWRIRYSGGLYLGILQYSHIYGANHKDVLKPRAQSMNE